MMAVWTICNSSRFILRMFSYYITFFGHISNVLEV